MERSLARDGQAPMLRQGRDRVEDIIDVLIAKRMGKAVDGAIAGMMSGAYIGPKDRHGRGYR